MTVPDIPSLISAARAAQHHAARAALARGLRHPITRTLLAAAAMAAATAYQAGHRVHDIHHHDRRFSDE
ncbi:hypothetical protein ACFTTN_03135 [Streptomyces niveus]|uniref:hypothetical protein n=1 Tax=Streptomyces niveus TaxID=193462 RepID=UPI0036252940